MSTTYGAGKYQAEVLGQGFQETTTKQTPYFSLVLKILGRYDDKDQLQPCPQFEREYKQYLANDVGVNILKGDLDVLGVRVNQLTQLAPESRDHVSLKGRQIDVCCAIESYKGKQIERWSIPRTRKKLDLSAVQMLNDKFGHLLRGSSDSVKPAAGVVKPNTNDAPF